MRESIGEPTLPMLTTTPSIRKRFARRFQERRVRPRRRKDLLDEDNQMYEHHHNTTSFTQLINRSTQGEKPKKEPKVLQLIPYQRIYYTGNREKYPGMCFAKENSAPQVEISEDMMTIRNKKV